MQTELPSARDAIAMIRASGGVAVWAHPFWDVDLSIEEMHRSLTALRESDSVSAEMLISTDILLTSA